MTERDLDLLLSGELDTVIRSNEGRDPAAVALDKNVPYARLVATQVKYRQRAAKKIPSFFDAGAIFTEKSYQQATSQVIAENRGYKGRACLDLTCGLGVDSWALSFNFDKVVTLEPDPLAARIARHNFALLGASNIEVVEQRAEDYVKEHTEDKYDLIFADPDRRDDKGHRKVVLEGCSPDIFTMLPVIKQMSALAAFKLSPLFDVAEAMKVFGPDCAVKVTSLGGECREVLVETGRDTEPGMILAGPVGHYASYRWDDRKNFKTGMGSSGKISISDIKDYIIIPDVALAKAGIVSSYFAGLGGGILNDSGVAIFETPFETPFGNFWRVIRSMNYNPKQIRPILEELKLPSLTLITRAFPYPVAQVCKQLGIREGSHGTAILTSLVDRPVMLLVERI